MIHVWVFPVPFSFPPWINITRANKRYKQKIWHPNLYFCYIFIVWHVMHVLVKLNSLCYYAKWFIAKSLLGIFSVIQWGTVSTECIKNVFRSFSKVAFIHGRKWLYFCLKCLSLLVSGQQNFGMDRVSSNKC